MKVLIINSNQNKIPWPVMPIGACYVASSMKQAGFEVKLLDLLFSTDPYHEVRNTVRDFSPALIGVSIRNLDNVVWHAPEFYLDKIKEDIIASIRDETKSPIVIGGPAVSILPARIMDYLYVDYAVAGEGERVLVDLANRLSNKTDISDIPGLTLRHDNKTITNPIDRVCDLNTLPTPKIYEWVDWKKYLSNYVPYPIQTKRGCSQKCTYCIYNKVEGYNYRLRDSKAIADEIEEIVAACNPPRIEFTDSTFNMPLDHALKICREIKDRNINATFSTMGVNPGAVTPELVSLMKQANFREIVCTPEAGSAKMLKALGKGFKIEQVKQAVQLLQDAEIPVVWNFLFGGPGEDQYTVKETFDFIENNISKKDLLLLQCGIRILPGTPIQTYAQKHGIISKDTDFLFPVWLEPEGIKLQDLHELVRREAETHGNYLLDNSENTLFSKFLKKLYAVLRIKEPIWRNIMRRDFVFEISGYNRYKKLQMKKAGANQSSVKSYS